MPRTPPVMFALRIIRASFQISDGPARPRPGPHFTLACRSVARPRPEVLERPDILLTGEPSLGQADVVRAASRLALRDRDSDADRFLGVGIGVIGCADVEVAVLHRLHGFGEYSCVAIQI
jgi:hypothetical protein